MKNIFIFVITVIFFTVVMEIFLQLTEITLPNPIGVDDKIGKILIPDSRINLIKEGLYLGEVNKYGYLGPAYPCERKANSIRIALMGDSYVEAYQLFEKYNFRTVIEEKLSADIPQDVEVLNFGRSGMTFGTMYTYYENFVKDFNPDIVLFVIGGDDFVIRNQALFPGLAISDDNELKITDNFRNGSLYKLRKNYNYLFNLSTFDLLKKSAKLVDEGYAMHILFDKLNPVPLFSREQVLSPDQEYNGESLADSNSLKILSRIFDNFNNQEKTTFAIAARAELDKSFTNIIYEKKIHFLPLYNYVESITTPEFDPNYWAGTNKRGHWNHEAHQLIGKYLASYIEKQLLPKTY